MRLNAKTVLIVVVVLLLLVLGFMTFQSMGRNTISGAQPNRPYSAPPVLKLDNVN